MQGSSLLHWSRILWCSAVHKFLVLVPDVSSRSSRTRSFVWTQMTEANWSKQEWRENCMRLCWIDAAKWRLIATANRQQCCHICGFWADAWFLYALHSCVVSAVWLCSLQHNTHARFIQCHCCQIQNAKPTSLCLTSRGMQSKRIIITSCRYILEALHHQFLEVIGMLGPCTEWYVFPICSFMSPLSVYIYEQ